MFGGIKEEETPAQNVECWEGGSRGTQMLDLGRKAVREKIFSRLKEAKETMETIGTKKIEGKSEGSMG